MKYLRTIVALGLMLVFTGASNNPVYGEIDFVANEPEFFKEARFFRVYFDKLGTAHDIVISMDAVESKYEKGYVIVQVTNSKVKLSWAPAEVSRRPKPSAFKEL
ncbi:MAG: hypothetical protein JRE64_17825 [Deltaproteobacteria bacterium]|nr:hypothetical protein [Deltaproteobacteria bacterium]